MLCFEKRRAGKEARASCFARNGVQCIVLLDLW